MPARNNREIVTKRDVTYTTAVGMEHLSKHVSAGRNTRFNIRAVFFSVGPYRGVVKVTEKIETPACQEVSLKAQESRDGIKLN
jgi:hypothetical protein